MSKYLTFHDWIIGNLDQGSEVLGFGSGPETIRLSKYFNMTSTEHDLKFIGKCKKANYIHVPIKGGLDDTCQLSQFKHREFGLILVDGPTGVIGRHNFLNNFHLFNLIHHYTNG